MKTTDLIRLFILFTLIISAGCSTEKKLHTLSFSKSKHHSIPDDNIATIKKTEIKNEFEEIQNAGPELSQEKEIVFTKNKLVKEKELRKIHQVFKQYYKVAKKNIEPDTPDDANHETNSFAIISFVTALLSILFSLIALAAGVYFLMGPLFALLAIIFGGIALRKIRKHAGEKGKGLAAAALAIGIIVLIAWLILFILVIFTLLFFSGLA